MNSRKTDKMLPNALRGISTISWLLIKDAKVELLDSIRRNEYERS